MVYRSWHASKYVLIDLLVEEIWDLWYFWLQNLNINNGWLTEPRKTADIFAGNVFK